MGNSKKEQPVVWDLLTLKKAGDDLFVEFSIEEWEIIREQLEKELCALPDWFLKKQNDAEVQRELVSLLKELSPILIKKAEMVLEKMDSKYRFCILKGLSFFELDDKARDLFMLGFSCLVGSPTATDKINGTILWPVRPELETLDTVKNTTFSQRTGEAAYHTDTQYFKNPEKYMSLWCLNPSKDGGGVSGLIDGRKVIENIEKIGGRRTIKILTDQVYPFRVPSVFTSKGIDSDIEIYYGAILSTRDSEYPLIRYRKETLDKGLVADIKSLSFKQTEALGCVEKVLADRSLEFEYFLKKGEVMFANNHELLHKRTHFDDIERYLVRIRLTPKI